MDKTRQEQTRREKNQKEARDQAIARMVTLRFDWFHTLYGSSRILNLFEMVLHPVVAGARTSDLWSVATMGCVRVRSTISEKVFLI